MAQRKIMCTIYKVEIWRDIGTQKDFIKKVNVNAETLKVGELTPLIFTLSDGTKCYVDSTESQFWCNHRRTDKIL